MKKYLRSLKFFVKDILRNALILGIMLRSAVLVTSLNLFHDRIEQFFIVFIHISKNCSSIEKIKLFVLSLTRIRCLSQLATSILANRIIGEYPKWSNGASC